jgi:conjugal transfer/entry exclusion protein
LVPCGKNMDLEYQMACPWRMAAHGHSKNQVVREVSEHEQVVACVGDRVHTCTLRATALRRATQVSATQGNQRREAQSSYTRRILVRSLWAVG